MLALIVLAMPCPPCAAGITTYDNEAAWSANVLSPTIADFEFAGVVADTYPGASFSGAGYPWQPATTPVFARTGSRSMYTAASDSWNATPWDVTFDTAQRAFSLWTFDLQAATFGDTVIEFYDESGVLLDSFGLGATGSGHGHVLWGFNGFISDTANISRVVVLPPNPSAYGGSRGGDALWYDDIAWSDAQLNEAPVAACDPTEITVEAEGDYGALITQLDGTPSFDPDGDAITYHWDVSDAGVILDDPDSPTPIGIFPIGISMATLTVSDGRGGVDTCDVLVTVEDTTPPEVMCTSDVAMLWPPNHEMRSVRLVITGTDIVADSSQIDVVTLTVRSDEPDDSYGDGTTAGDVDGSDGFTGPVDVTALLVFDATVGANGAWVADIQLRAERDGAGDGRCYTIDVVAVDPSGNLAQTSCCIVVPHDRRRN